eukprot:3691213-Pleurochrysis_carterae.AAC.1
MDANRSLPYSASSLPLPSPSHNSTHEQNARAASVAERRNSTTTPEHAQPGLAQKTCTRASRGGRGRTWGRRAARMRWRPTQDRAKSGRTRSARAPATQAMTSMHAVVDVSICAVFVRH